MFKVKCLMFNVIDLNITLKEISKFIPYTLNLKHLSDVKNYIGFSRVICIQIYINLNLSL